MQEILSEVKFLSPFKSCFGFSIGKEKSRFGLKIRFIGFVPQISILKQQKKGLYFGMICQKFGYFDLGRSVLVKIGDASFTGIKLVSDLVLVER